MEYRRKVYRVASVRLEALESQGDLIKRLTDATSGIAVCRKAMQGLINPPVLDHVQLVLQRVTWQCS